MKKTNRNEMNFNKRIRTANGLSSTKCPFTLILGSHGSLNLVLMSAREGMENHGLPWVCLEPESQGGVLTEG